MGSVVSSIFGGKPKQPKPTPPPPPPEPPKIEDAGAKAEAAERARNKRRASSNAVGRSSTVLTSNGGVSGAANTKKKTLGS